MKKVNNMKVNYEIVDEKPTTHKWWVYVHTTPCGMHYVGVSSLGLSRT